MQSHALSINLTAASLEKYLIYKGHTSSPVLSSLPSGQCPLPGASCHGIAWQIFLPLRRKEFPLPVGEERVPTASHGPTAAGRAADAALNRETNSTVIPIFTQYLSYLCNCQYFRNCYVPDCTCAYFIHVIISFQLHHLP